MHHILESGAVTLTEGSSRAGQRRKEVCVLVERSWPAMYQQQRNCLLLPRPGLLMDKMNLQVLDLGDKVVPSGYLFLRFRPRILVLPEVLQLVDPLQRRT